MHGAVAKRPDNFPSASKALAALNHLANEIESAPSLEAVEAIANAAAGYQRQFKDVFEVADRAGEIWVDAEVKIGSELVKKGDATGTRGQLRSAGPGRGKKGKTSSLSDLTHQLDIG